MKKKIIIAAMMAHTAIPAQGTWRQDQEPQLCGKFKIGLGHMQPH